MDEHTFRYMRDEEENLLPELSNRDGETGRSMLQVAHDKVEKILGEHRPGLDSAHIDRIKAWADEKGRQLAK